MLIAGGIVAQLVGVLALREGQKHASWSARLIACVLLTGSIWLMSLRLGWELGVAWALTSVSLAAWILILFPFFGAAKVGHDRIPRSARRAPAPPSGSKWRLTVKLISAGPLYLIAALGLSLLIATKQWAPELTRLYIGGLSSPLFWSIGALHATVDPSLARVTIFPIALAALSFGVFYLT